MALSRQLLQTAMNRLLSKLNTLLMPRVEHQGCRLGPLAAEIRASAELMRWFASELSEARAMLADELVAQHRNWPNVVDWRNFVRAIEALTVDLDTEAIGDFDEARDLLLEECRQMLSVAPGAAAPGKASQGTFLPTDSQRRVYRELVLTYYREYIVGKDLKHGLLYTRPLPTVRACVMCSFAALSSMPSSTITVALPTTSATRAEAAIVRCRISGHDV